MINPSLNKDPNDDIGKPIDDYVTHMVRLDPLNTLMGGTAAMRAARTKYLPQEPEESNLAYENRLNRSTLLNAFKRTVSYLSGQIFSKPIILLDDNPNEIKELSEDIDRQHNNIDVFCKKVFEAGLVDGITFILVDYPKAPTDLTKEDEKKIGVRPYWVHIPFSSVIGWRTENIDGKVKLTQIRIKEEVEVNDGKYGIKKVKRIRLLEPGYYEIYEDDSDGKETSWKLIESGEISFKDEIPLVIFRPGEKISYMIGSPPLEDLGYLNIAHWQSNSDQVTILHYSRVPLLFGKMLADDINKIVIGSNYMIHSNREDADLKYVEHTGQAIGSGRDNLDDLEQNMSLFGLQLLMPKTGRITATEKALSSSENDCTLKTWGQMFKDSIEQCIVFTCDWMKLSNPGSVRVNLEFRLLQTADADVLVKAYIAGILPRHLILQEFLRRGIIAEDSDLDQIEEWLLEDQQKKIFLSNANSLAGLTQNMSQGLPQPGGVLPEPNVPVGNPKRPALPNFTKKGK